MTIDEARRLMHEWVASPALRVHMECVAACMAAYARQLAPDDVERWRVCGLLHDFDWERHPTLEEHPVVGVAHLRALGTVDEEICRAILAHAPRTGVPRDTPMARALFATDELCGFLVACALVRPSKSLDDLEVSSVRKKLKDKAFARTVNRDDIRQGVAELGADLDEHVRFVIEALKPVQEKIGLKGGG